VGTVDRINPVANEGSRFIPVHIRLDNLDGRLWGGMFATGSILVREGAGLVALPATAIREDAEGRFVLKLEDGKLVRQPVESGPSWSGGRLVEILNGVAAGDTIVSAPLTELQPDAAVVVSEAH
jgi:multidrug efflux pump subunit AcrA (membrane-fusion protein)